ncbi:MAG TPA: shikimate synthase, partial [Planctomycetes bacterium]|nr:shikimate synthase [Planctomycetota bacterium]
TRGLFPLQFFREGEGSAPDQPYLLEWASAPIRPSAFAAILGEPVGHSFTPACQGPFFRSRGIPVLSVDLRLEEWKEGAVTILEELGLRYAAVTSPLKREAYALLERKTGAVEELESANTIFRDPRTGAWWGTNTDLPGLLSFLREEGRDLPREAVAVWGGGGTLPILERAFPSAAFHAARTGLLRRGRPVPDPTLLVWATPRMGAAPPDEWSPKAVFDLSYREDSPGRIYALSKGARYTSGLGMYLRQAALQRAWWEERERGG